MQDRYLLRLGLIAAFLITALIFFARKNLRENWLGFLDVVKDFKTDIASSIKKEDRKRPLSTAIKETHLALWVGEPFRSFSVREWQDFWRLIYGKHYMDNPLGRGWPKVYRQLTLEEIKLKLIDLYPFPFSRFSGKDWSAFFGIILKEK